MSILLGCIADDFTGATDLAAILSRSGVPVRLRFGIPKEPTTDVAPFEIIALKCRTSPVADATAEARAAFRWLDMHGAVRIFWKYCSTFDSRPEGNIGPVADTLLEALRERQANPESDRKLASFDTSLTVHSPAFPENGRSVYRSMLFVHDEPLHESPMRDHPLTPMHDANLVRTLTPQVSGKVDAVTWPTVRDGHVAVRSRLEALGAEGVEHVIVDAIDDTDLLVAVRATEQYALLCGGSALALHLPALFRVRGWLKTSDVSDVVTPQACGRLVLAGSCSSMTRRQVAAFAREAPSFVLDPIALADGNQLAQAEQWLLSQALDTTPMISASAPPEKVADAQQKLGADRAGRVVEQALSALAVTAVDAGRRSLVVAGGETSGAVCQALGISDVSIGREIAPGVPWTHASRTDGDLSITLKSGNFGDETFFSEAFAVLDAD